MKNLNDVLDDIRGCLDVDHTVEEARLPKPIGNTLDHLHNAIRGFEEDVMAGNTKAAMAATNDMLVFVKQLQRSLD